MKQKSSSYISKSYAKLGNEVSTLKFYTKVLVFYTKVLVHLWKHNMS